MKKTISAILAVCIILASSICAVSVSAETTYYDRTTGITYTLHSNGNASVTDYNDIGEYTETAIPHFTPAKSNGRTVTGNTDGIDYTIGAGTPGETTVHADFLPKSNPHRRSGEGTRTPLAVVIHTTSMYASTDNAMSLLSYQKNQPESNYLSWHYTVGMDCITQSLPENEMAYHAGDGGQGYFNKYSIGIENCVAGFPFPDTSEASDWKKGDQKKLQDWYDSIEIELDRLAVLVSEICVRYGLDPEKDVKQHNDASGKNCPMQFRYDFELGVFKYEGTYWKIFKNKLKAYYEAFTNTAGGTYVKVTSKASSTVNIPASITVNGYTYTVRSISSKAFADKNDNLKVIEIPSTVTDIASDAFENSAKLSHVNVDTKNRVYASRNGIVYLDSSVFFKPPVNPTNDFDESKLASKIYVSQVNGSTTVGNESYVWANTTARLSAPYWNRAVAVYNSAMKAYKVTALYKSGNDNPVYIEDGQIAVVAHGTKITSAWNSVKVGSYLYLSGDIDLINKECSSGAFVGVYNGTTFPAAPAEPAPTPYPSGPFELKDPNSTICEDASSLGNISPNLTASAFTALFVNDVEVINASGQTVSGTKSLATGYLIRCSGETKQLIINGDVDGNGKVDTTDVLLLKQHFKGTYLLEGIYYKAADLSGKGKLTVSDYVMIKRYILNTINI